jgi:hypothetical protein
MSQQHLQHTILPGDSLAGIAQEYGLAGWQALYFAGCNVGFRMYCPNPNDISMGTVITIPTSADEQRAALTERLRRLEQTKKDAFALRAEQLGLLARELQRIERNGISNAEGVVSEMVPGLAATTLRAVALMKLADDAMSAANMRLAKDALRRSATSPIYGAAQLMTLAKRAARGVIWLTAKWTAEAWCDMASANFWANRIVNLLDDGGHRRSFTDEPARLLRLLKKNNQVATDSVVRDIDEKIQEAVQELNVLSDARAS